MAKKITKAKTAKKVKNKARINQNLSVKALQKKIKELTAENNRLTAELSIARGNMRNVTGRRSVISLQESLGNNNNTNKEFAAYSGKGNNGIVTTKIIQFKERRPSHSYYFHQDIKYDKTFLDDLQEVSINDVMYVADKYLKIVNPVTVIIK